MAQPTMWERVKGGSKSGFDKTWKAMDKLGAPVNKLSNKLGSEAFWPTTLDKESDKAARILKTFCKDGFYAEEEFPTAEGPKQKQRVVKKIPTSVIQNAKGLAIFTTMRTGLWISGAGGSGVLIARKQDGTWSPPSGILLHTAGLGFLVGVDIYDCVVVINTYEALEAFTKLRATLGSEVSVAAGPVGAGGVLDTELHKRQAPIFTYLKSRGFYAGVQIDGTVVIERTDENERFYGQRMPVADILAGKVRHPPFEVRRLLETVRAAQGDTDVDESILPTEAPPSDFEIDDGRVFGVPDREDPDPYGVLALEKEGMSVKEAGTQKRASWEVFTFNPAPTSPIASLYDRTNSDHRRSASVRSSWRSSATSPEFKSPPAFRRSFDPPPRHPSLMDRPPQPQRYSALAMADSATQTDDEDSVPSRKHSRGSSIAPTHMQDVPENATLDVSPDRRSAGDKETAANAHGYTTPPQTPPPPVLRDMTPEPIPESVREDRDDDDEEEEEDEPRIEEPVVQSVRTFPPASTAQVITKARLVTVQKREPPSLPPRNPNRFGGPLVVDTTTSTAAADDVSVESKHDSTQDAHVTSTETAESPVSSLAEEEGNVSGKLEDVRLDGDAQDDDFEDARPEPWAMVEEVRPMATQTATHVGWH